MNVTVYALLGGMAFILSLFTVARSLERDTDIILTAVAFIMWAVWSLSSTQVSVASNGEIVYESYPGLLFLGAVFAFVMVVSLVKKVVEGFEIDL